MDHPAPCWDDGTRPPLPHNHPSTPKAAPFALAQLIPGTQITHPHGQGARPHVTYVLWVPGGMGAAWDMAGMCPRCHRLPEPAEAATLSLASSLKADKSPWVLSCSSGVTGTEPYLLCCEASLGELRGVPAPCRHSSIVLSRLQEVRPMRGEALCLKPLGSA